MKYQLFKLEYQLFKWNTTSSNCITNFSNETSIPFVFVCLSMRMHLPYYFPFSMQCMELPLVRKDSSSQSASTNSTTTSSPGTNSPQSPINVNNDDPFPFPFAKHLHRMHYLTQVPLTASRNTSLSHISNGGGGSCGSSTAGDNSAISNNSSNISNNNGLLSQLRHNPQRHHRQQQQQSLRFKYHPHPQHQHPQTSHNQQVQSLPLLHPVPHQFPHQDPQHLYYHQQHHPSSPPAVCGDKNNVHKFNFDTNPGHRQGHEEIWVRSGHQYQQEHLQIHQPHSSTSIVSGKPDPSLLGSESLAGGDPQHRELYKDQSYVVFNKNKGSGPPPPPHDHDYSYPNLEPVQKPPAQRSSTKKQALSSGRRSSLSYPPLPMKNKSRSKSGGGGGGGLLAGVDNGGGSSSSSSRPSSGVGNSSCSGTHTLLAPSTSSSARVQCKHCREVFSVDDNVRGSCEDAPDSVERCIECVSCVSCFSCLMYHCLADADGSYVHPCSCGPSDHCKRWTALSILSIFIPCLWCYPPLKACHYCGTRCGLCGGRHKAA